MNPDENTSLESFQFEDFVLNPRTRSLFRGRQRITIQSRAFDTLAVLVERHGQVVGKETLLGLVWPETAGEENNLA